MMISERDKFESSSLHSASRYSTNRQYQSASSSSSSVGGGGSSSGSISNGNNSNGSDSNSSSSSSMYSQHPLLYSAICRNDNFVNNSGNNSRYHHYRSSPQSSSNESLVSTTTPVRRTRAADSVISQSVERAHQNDTHDSLAASMPLLSAYLKHGTIQNYPNQSHYDPVRFGRVPKREKAKILAAMQKVNAHSMEKALGAVLEDEHQIAATIARAHDETCDYTSDKVTPLLDAARARPIYAQCPPQMTCPLNPIPAGMVDGQNAAARLLEDFSERFSPAIRGVVEFAKRIPGFSMLAQEDQVTLLKAGVFEVLLVRLACMFDSSSASMVCLNGLVLRRDAIHAASHARFLMDSMFDFATQLNHLQLSDHELGLFCAVVVIAPDRPGLRNAELVQKINKRLEEVLQKAIASRYQTEPTKATNIFTDLIAKIPDLRTLNTLHSEKLLGKSFTGGVVQLQTSATSETPMMGVEQPSITSSSADVATSNLHLLANSGIVHQQQTLAQQQAQQQQQQAQQQQQQPDSQSDAAPSPWSASLGHYSPAASSSFEDGAVSPSHFGSPRSNSSSSGVSSEDSTSRKGSLSLPGVPPKLAYLQYIRAMQAAESQQNGSTPPAGCPFSKHIYSYTDEVVPTSVASSTTVSAASVCSSPRSESEHDTNSLKRKCPTSSGDSDDSDTACSERQESIDDMPVLKRALQAPPLVNTNKLMDEAYRHHKKFRAARRAEVESSVTTTTTKPDIPTVSSPNSSSEIRADNVAQTLASSHSTLLSALEQPSRYMNEQQLKRTDLIHNIIMSSEAVSPSSGSLSSGVVPVSVTKTSEAQQSSSATTAAVAATVATSAANITVMYPSGCYHNIPVASAPTVCPYTGRTQVLSSNVQQPVTAVVAAAQPTTSKHLDNKSSPVLVIGPSQAVSHPYSHLQRCLAVGNTAPLSIHGSMLPAQGVSHDDDDDMQPLNLSTKC